MKWKTAVEINWCCWNLMLADPKIRNEHWLGPLMVEDVFNLSVKLWPFFSKIKPYRTLLNQFFLQSWCDFKWFAKRLISNILGGILYLSPWWCQYLINSKKKIFSFKKIQGDDFADCAYKNNLGALRWSFSDLLDSNQLRLALFSLERQSGDFSFPWF